MPSSFCARVAIDLVLHTFEASLSAILIMRASSIIALSAVVVGVAAAPFQFPLADGFPTLSNASLENVTIQAKGSVPTAKLPKYVKPAGVVALQLFGYNEVMEVAFFAQLLANVTNNVPGYEASSLVPLTRDYVIDMLNAIVNVRILL